MTEDSRLLGASIFLMVIGAGISESGAASQQSFDLQNMTCQIRSVATDRCTSIPALHSGVLAVDKAGTFTLEGKYHSCFMAEQVTYSGRFRVSYFNRTIRLELLTTRTSGSSDATGDFPRTLGLVSLDKGTLTGYWVDFSPVIRGQGRHTEKIAPPELHCEANE